jgi:hypothetical protein
MRSVVAWILVCAVVLAIPAVAAEQQSPQQPSQHSDMRHMTKGEITAWNAEAKTCTVKDHAGKEIAFSWNDKTTIEGTPKVGVVAEVHFKYEQDGKVRVAEKIVVVVSKK